MSYFVKLFAILFMSLIFIAQADAFNSSLAKVTLEIIGEDDIPIDGADVGIGFGVNGEEDTEFGGTSSAAGFYSAFAATNGRVGWTIKKFGYYESWGVYDFNEKTFARWLPWNPTIRVLLRKIENPIPMYARDTSESRVEIPEIVEDIGFDLIKFDWVIPYGSGTNSDFIFHLQRRVVDRRDFDSTLTVTFSNKYDGIQSYREELKDGSLFKLPRYAPETGYEKKLVLREWRDQGEATVHRNIDFNAKDLNYIFRVRSKEEKGVVTEAMYGKIIGGLRFDPVFSKTAKIFFKFYLNPDRTRNLEFDPEKNLFGPLPSLEKVGIK